MLQCYKLYFVVITYCYYCWYSMLVLLMVDDDDGDYDYDYYCGYLY